MPRQEWAKVGAEDYITEPEREKLLANLHRVLVWVGSKEPETVQIDTDAIEEELQKFHQTVKDLPPEVNPEKGTVELHRLIWRLINEKEITDEERIQIEEIIDLLQKAEQREENILKVQRLTRVQARQLYEETAGCIRALLDLKDLLKSKEQFDTKKEASKRKVDDVRRWNKFIDQIEKDRS
jgi:Family of unknown function (DUF5788)